MNFFVIFSAPSTRHTHAIVGTVYKNREHIGKFLFEYRSPEWLDKLILPSNNAVDSRKRKKDGNYQTDDSPGMRRRV